MIFADFLKALAQLPERGFRRVLLLGIALTLALLIAVTAVFLLGLQSFLPDQLDLPWIGPVEGLSTLLSWGAFGLMLVLSVFLMVPVASVFTGFFLDRVADAVEKKHYPGLPPPKGLGLYESLRDGVNFLGLLVALNALALILGLMISPALPVIFWGVNGWLLGREYFTLAAARRIGLEAARALRARHRGQIFAAGVLMAIPLSLPLVSLLIPVLGAATFTHLYHRLAGTRAAR